jgi:hypothetical protein
MSTNTLLRGIGVGAALASFGFIVLSPIPEIVVTIPENFSGSVYTKIIPYSKFSKTPLVEFSQNSSGTIILKHESRRVHLKDGTPALEFNVLLGGQGTTKLMEI